MEKNEIGNVGRIRFVNLGDASLSGKVDTGAEISSLHTDGFTIRDGRVIFRCHLISPNQFTVPLSKTVQVRNSDGGIEERPVIKTPVSLDGHLLPDIEFTLNDRSKNDSAVLIGQNLLRAGGFVVNPNAKPIPEGKNIGDTVEISLQSDTSPQVPMAEPAQMAPSSMPINVIDTSTDTKDPLEAVVSMIKNSNIKVWQIVKRLEEDDESDYEEPDHKEEQLPAAVPPEQIEVQNAPVDINIPSKIKKSKHKQHDHT